MKENIKILIVDDFPMIRTMLRRSLNDLGYKQLQEASDGSQAWDLLQQNSKQGAPFDLVFMDWNMPIMTGIEVVEKCKADPTLSTTPIIMISAERDRTNVIRAMKAGANDYILKPFSAATLAEKISKLVVDLENTPKVANG